MFLTLTTFDSQGGMAETERKVEPFLRPATDPLAYDGKRNFFLFIFIGWAAVSGIQRVLTLWLSNIDFKYKMPLSLLTINSQKKM